MIRRLGVNIDHVATLRQARRSPYPDPVTAAALAELAGADQITCHIRGDRRHIQDRDLPRLRDVVQTHLNVEMATTAEMLDIAEAVLGHGGGSGKTRPSKRRMLGDIDIDAGYDSLAFADSTDVPEPASMALLGAALLGLGVAARRRASA